MTDIVNPRRPPDGWSDVVPQPTDTAEWDVEIRHGRCVIRYRRSNLSLPIDIVLPIGFVKGLVGALLQMEGQQMGNRFPPLPPNVGGGGVQ